MIAKVEPLTSARALRGPFDYRLSGRLGEVDVGSMLVVPFGRQRMLGVVVGLADESEVPAERLVEPLTLLDPEVPAELVKLGLWVAEEYCSTPARGLGLVLPPGTGRNVKQRVKARRALVAELGVGSRVSGLGSAEFPGPVGERQRAALDTLRAGPLPAAELCRLSGASHASLHGLAERGLIVLEQREIGRRPEVSRVGARAAEAPVLSDAQGAALAGIVSRLDAEAGGKLLLHGVTGSGKTEVYLQAVAAALERGRSAIVLVPEIALTPQTAGRFQERFGDAVAVLHSKLGAGERYDEWARLRRGEARVCVGPRSAIFAPLTDLGLIVIDEEHDPSYKQESDPRYDARHVAERRAEQAGAVLVAGSATPRPESRLRLERLVLPERVDGRGLPPVEIVGMAGVRSALHERTRDALDTVRRRGEKAIVLLNRRGWSNFLTCRVCARVWTCPDCDVSLVLHRAAGIVACHHCGHEESAPSTCPDCGSVSVARHGAGTERLEQELEELVRPLPVFRLDSDAAAGRGAITRVLERFDSAPNGVLVGTQMVAKGHDFPEVTLGVVLDADATLRFPDFRAEERTFALVAQLAGRSGRGPRGGRVIVQALEPEARSLRHAAAHDSDGFVAGELERRRLLRYPPFGHLIRIVCSSEAPEPQSRAAEALVELLAPLEGSVLGPAPLFRLKGRARSQIVVKAEERGHAVEVVRAAVETVAPDHGKSGVSFSVDVDPQ
ncbi:MAG TPA: primosomal protein N' [Thermoleophilaceae bacterium]|nr:primosomal protein N' [Thermoleophilaceae bacterium]